MIIPPSPRRAKPPVAWKRQTKKTNVLSVPGVTVAYWGRPTAKFSREASRKIRTIVVHYPAVGARARLPDMAQRLVDHLHRTCLGYHFYVDRNGRVVQGAPLNRRTCHVKPPGHIVRRSTAPGYIRNGNSVGISLIGACDPSRTNPGGHKWNCRREWITPAQWAAAIATIKALQDRFQLPCNAIIGHGELQTDRNHFEGQLLTQAIKRGCRSS